MRQWILGLLLVFAFCSPVNANDGIAIVKSTAGKVSVKRLDDTLPIKPKDRLLVGDILITGGNSRVGIIFHDGSVLALEENSFFRIKEFVFQPIEDKFDFKLFLKKGTALFESGKIGTLSPKSFRFEIPQGTVGIRGTKFLVEVK